MDRSALWWAGAIVAAWVLLASDPQTVATSVLDDAPGRPHPEEVLLFEELAQWVGRGDGDSLAPFPGDSSLAVSVRSRSESFALFCAPVGEGARRAVFREVPFASEIERAARRHRVDAFLVAAMIDTESSFDPLAISSQGALGLMQMMPETARGLGAADVWNPAQNVEAGARYLGQLLRRYREDLPLALAAYNAGPGTIDRYGGVPPFAETRSYVDRVLRRYLDYRQSLWQRAVETAWFGAGDSAPGVVPSRDRKPWAWSEAAR